eukprot:3937876-Rhodomonas_salina.1
MSARQVWKKEIEQQQGFRSALLSLFLQSASVRSVTDLGAGGPRVYTRERDGNKSVNVAATLLPSHARCSHLSLALTAT